MRKTPLITLVFLPFILRAQGQLDSLGQRIKTESIQDSISRIDSLRNKKSLYRVINRNTNDNLIASSSQDTIPSISGIIHRANTKSKQIQDSLQNIGNQPSSVAKEKLDEAEKKLKEKSNAINDKVEQKATTVKDKIQTGLSKTTDGQLDGSQTIEKIPGAILPSSDLKKPEIVSDRMAVPGIDVQVDEVKIPTATESIPQIKSPELSTDKLTEKILHEIPGGVEIKDVQKEIKGVDGKLGQVDQYKKDLNKMKEGDAASVEKLSKEAEQKIGQTEELKTISESTSKLTKQQAEYEAMLQKYRDKKILQEEVKRKMKNVANDKINKYSEVVKNSQADLAKTKKLNSTVQDVKQLKQKRTNELKSKPFHERLVPGITLQASNSKEFTINWGVECGYRLTPRLLLGAGGVYRMNISDKYPNYIHNPGVYGYRIYSDFKAIKSFYLHGEMESLHTDPYLQTYQKREVPSQQVISGYGGILKRYDLSKKIKGSILLLYRFQIKNELPSSTKIGVRIGFDLNMKTTRRK